ncbi:hypothetical protein EAH79_10320 [Sphingomonas koreensis]|nr:hypothetical protein EAH79_10320 [Sphingomonas koreensis]
MTQAQTPRGNRMLRHDLRVIWREGTSILARWSDAALLLIGAAVIVVMARGALADAAPRIVGIAGLIIGLWSGWSSEQMIARRLRFHADAYVFATDAIQRDTRLGYRAALHGAIGGLLLGAAAIAGVWPLWSLAGGYLIGAVIAGGIDVAPRWAGAECLFSENKERVRLVSVAALALAAVVTSGLMGNQPGAIALPVALTALAAAVLTPIDAATARFEAIAGRDAAWSIARHLRGAAIIVLATAGLIAIVAGASLAGMALLAGAVMLVAAVVRVLAYRALDRRAADLVLTAGIAVVAVGAMVAVVLAPVLAIGMAVGLYRRSQRARWIIA